MPQPVVVTLQLLFAVLAVILFGISGFTDWIPEPKRLKVVACGLFFLTLAFFVAVRL